MIISTDRTEFISDCIISIAMTIMAIDIGVLIAGMVSFNIEWDMFVKLMLSILIYTLSFTMLGIIWIGHHNFYRVTKYIDIKLLWHNLHVLFWLTLLPFATSMVGRHHLLPLSIALYSFIMLMVSLAFAISRSLVLRQNLLLKSDIDQLNERLNEIAKIKQLKTYIAICLYFISIPLAFVFIPFSYICMIIPAILYLLPDEIKNKRHAKSLYSEMKKKHE